MPAALSAVSFRPDVGVVVRRFERLAQFLQWPLDARQRFVEGNLSKLVPRNGFVSPPNVIKEQIAPAEAVFVVVDPIRTTHEHKTGAPECAELRLEWFPVRFHCHLTAAEEVAPVPG
jgi:hypothetical protein